MPSCSALRAMPEIRAFYVRALEQVVIATNLTSRATANISGDVYCGIRETL